MSVSGRYLLYSSVAWQDRYSADESFEPLATTPGSCKDTAPSELAEVRVG